MADIRGMGSDSDGSYNPSRRSASNMSIQAGNGSYPGSGTPIDPADHPATNIPDATDHHDGTVLSTGMDRLRTQFQQSDAKSWMDVSGQDSQNIDTIVRGIR